MNVLKRVGVKMKILKRLGVVISVATAALVVAASPAQALTRGCSINGAYFWLPNTCWTDSVWANSDWHGVNFHIGSYAGCESDFVVVDIANNVVVRSGRASVTDGVVYGLYSAYRLEVTRVGAHCGGNYFIDNN